MIQQLNRTAFRVLADAGQKFLFISDVHFDAMKCDRELLTKHLTEAKREGAKVFVFGDWFRPYARALRSTRDILGLAT